MEISLFNPSESVKDLQEMEFSDLGAFDDGSAGVFWSRAGGPSPWEMHPDSDELLHVIEGEIELEILPSDGGDPIFATVKTGWYLVIPRGCWHRQTLQENSKEFYLTPGQTLHSMSADPRNEE